MNTKSIALIFILFLLAHSQIAYSQANTVVPNGYNRFFYGDGKISSEGPMRNGKPDGYWKTYHVNGKLKSEGNRKNYQLDSTWLFYDEEGNITKKIDYAADKRNGLYQVYKLSPDSDNNNVLISKELYLNDIKQGISYYYYDNGKLHMQVNFQDNRRHGEGLEFDQEGNIITEYVFRNDITISKSSINRYDRAGQKSGTWKTFHPNGKVHVESYYKIGKLNGYVKEYDEKGKLISSKRYIEGNLYVEPEDNSEKMIVKKDFYENGKVKNSGGYINDIPVGQHTTFSEAGEIILTKRYNQSGILLSMGIMDEKGLKQGEWKYFYLSGKLKSIGVYKNDRRQDEWVFYHENGQIEQQGKYDKRGKSTGIWQWFHDNGTKLREEEYKDGYNDGLAIEYDRSGNIVSKGNYVEGLKEGAWYFNVGDEIQEGDFKADLKDGIWKHYFPDKKLKFEGRYVDGEEQGLHRYYYPDGKLKMEGEFSMGKRHNIWKFYDEEGILRTTITYQFDEEQLIDGKRIVQGKKEAASN